jgi:ribonucleoside-diphosphate reductase alpha chain
MPLLYRRFAMIDQSQDQLHLRGVDPLQGRKLFVRKRDSRIEEFNEARISLAMESAFKAVEGIGRDAALPGHLQSAVKKCADVVVERVLGRAVRGEQLEVERIQDAVEDQLMLDGHLAVARRYILYREKRRLARAEREGRATPPVAIAFSVKGTPPRESPPPPPVPAPVQAAKREEPPAAVAATVSAARSFLEKIYSQALPNMPLDGGLEAMHRRNFSVFINEGQYLNLLAPELLDFDLEMLAGALRLERDDLFPLAGLQALHDDYLLHDDGRRIETPQYFWMRLAMGLALNEGEQCNARALEFYEALSTFRFVPAETVLAHAGTVDPQLMTCCAATSWSDLEHVTAQFGPRLAPRKKTGLTCSWLEPWHTGIWDFLQRPRPGGPVWNHDLNKALWVPDLFMKRVSQQGRWTLFDPAEVPELHQKFGRIFEEHYLACEQKADRGEMHGFQRINAADLWQEMLASLAQTGQPWLGFKDAANIRSTQDHAGVVHSASLCTAILLNTSPSKTAACSVGSVNLAAHLSGNSSQPLDFPLLQGTVGAAMRMLDNAIDISSYPGDAARAASREHRPAALGILGFQDALDCLKISYASAAAADFADRSMEIVAHCAILASAGLARERGAYPSYEGSKWSHGLLPIDTLALLAAERGLAVDIDLSTTQDWDMVREAIQRDGLRHCTTTAISPTDAGSRITGASPSIEPSGLEGKGKQRTAFEIAPQWLIECAARRQKWLDMSQALTLYAADLDLVALAEMVMQSWEKGLKTTRQLHSQARISDDAPQPVSQSEKENQRETGAPSRSVRAGSKRVAAR